MSSLRAATSPPRAASGVGGIDGFRRIGGNFWLLCCALPLALCLLAAPAAAEAQEQSWGYALAHELMSPYCPGRTLAACTSGQATELRQWILLQEAAGATREEVIAILEERFGDVIRSRPEATGWGLAAWLLPGAALLLGGGLAAFTLRRVVAPPDNNNPPNSTASENVPPVERASNGRSAPISSQELERLVDEEFAAGDR